MTENAEANLDEGFALELLRSHLIEHGATEFQCEVNANLITTQAKRNLSSRSGIGGVLSAT